jgi:hypothetical protein
MKRILSLISAFALVLPAVPASAGVRLGGEAGIRIRGEFRHADTKDIENHEDDLKYQYRVRFNASAEPGEGYFFKAQLQYEGGASGVWQTVGHTCSELYTLQVSSAVIGRVLEHGSFAVGRLPLGSLGNPVFDLGFYPSQPLEIPVATLNFNRFFGAGYTAQNNLGSLSATLLLLDNASAGKVFGDGYALHLALKTQIGAVTIEPQLLAVLTDTDVYTQNDSLFKQNVTPLTVGASLTFPVRGVEIGMNGFCTMTDEHPSDFSAAVDYRGFLFRLKAEKGPFMAWVDYNRTIDRSPSSDETEYVNTFIWAQYRFPLHESPGGTFSLTPTVRYLSSSIRSGSCETGTGRLRMELYAAVKF